MNSGFVSWVAQCRPWNEVRARGLSSQQTTSEFFAPRKDPADPSGVFPFDEIRKAAQILAGSARLFFRYSMTVTERIEWYRTRGIEYTTAYAIELGYHHRGETDALVQFQVEWFAAPPASLREPGAA